MLAFEARSCYLAIHIMNEEPVVWAFDLGKGSIGEAVRRGTEFLHKASLLIPPDFAETIRMLEACKFPVESAVGLTVPIEEAGEALASWSANPAKFRKIQVRLD